MLQAIIDKKNKLIIIGNNDDYESTMEAIKNHNIDFINFEIKKVDVSELKGYLDIEASKLLSTTPIAIKRFVEPTIIRDKKPHQEQYVKKHSHRSRW